ncbi:hypothetical protein F4808DRAFT_79288 [Astrocystis sublimbata]|nr:hypothetical protein F4808DRAFT_79288 [Astrocystis sublimbata]
MRVLRCTWSHSAAVSPQRRQAASRPLDRQSISSSDQGHAKYHAHLPRRHLPTNTSVIVRYSGMSLCAAAPNAPRSHIEYRDGRGVQGERPLSTRLVIRNTALKTTTPSATCAETGMGCTLCLRSRRLKGQPWGKRFRKEKPSSLVHGVVALKVGRGPRQPKLSEPCPGPELAAPVASSIGFMSSTITRTYSRNRQAAGLNRYRCTIEEIDYQDCRSSILASEG